MGARMLAGGSAVLVFAAVVIAAVVATVAVFDQTAPKAPAPGGGSTPSPEAVTDIPPNMLVLYQQAAPVCPGLDWSVLAGIGKVETNHGRSTLPGVATGENSAGSAGPMQFLAPTFDAVTARHPLPTGGARPPSRYNAADAIYAAAYYLCDSGAPSDLHAAIYAYNHADWYVQQVLDQAARYRLTPGSGDCTTRPTDPRILTVIAFACAQLGQPYVWGGNGPETSGGWDCSGLVKAAYATIGIDLPRTTDQQVHYGPRIPENQLQPGDLLFFGTPDNVHHVGLYLGAGHILHAPDFGKPVQINDYHQNADYYTATRPINTTEAPNNAHPAQ